MCGTILTNMGCKRPSLRTLLLTAMLLAIVQGMGYTEETGMTAGTISIRTDHIIGTINPNIYGHFTEHIGGVIYDGIWVGKDSKTPNIHGIRKDLIDSLKRINPSVIRWPGGCFADRYHWMDGIGPSDMRPKRYGRWSDATEPNSFGTHEFIEFCRLTGAEPYIAGNVGTGTAEEFQAWIEYCNAPADTTTYAELREKNGQKEPFNVKYWGVGNEAWGCGGNFTPEDYCTEYRKFATWLPEYRTPLYLIACGPNGNDVNWTRRFFTKYRDGSAPRIDGWAAHYYCGSAGSATQFNEGQWYELIEKGTRMDKLIQDQWTILEQFDPQHHIKLIVDEWGCWHPAGTEINKVHLFEQMSTLRDAVVAAMTLDIFNRHCDKVSMANVAQLVNNLHSLFLADGPRFVATPNFYVYEMYKVHQGANGVVMQVLSPTTEFTVGNDKMKLADLHGSASVSGNVLHISVVNCNALKSVEATINLGDAKVTGGKQTVLTNQDIHAHNTFEKPNEVIPVSSLLSASGTTFKHTFPPASINVLELNLQ